MWSSWMAIQWFSDMMHSHYAITIHLNQMAAKFQCEKHMSPTNLNNTVHIYRRPSFQHFCHCTHLNPQTTSLLLLCHLLHINSTTHAPSYHKKWLTQKQLVIELFSLNITHKQPTSGSPQNWLSYQGKIQISNITPVNTTTNHRDSTVYDASIFCNFNSWIVGVNPTQMMDVFVFQCYWSPV